MAQDLVSERMPQSRTQRGRPRSADMDAAILTAVLDLLAHDGYSRMSVDAVAARAGVSKPSIYLRYPSKADLATAALEQLRLRDAPEFTDDIRADLIAHLEHFREVLERVDGMAMIGTCFAERTRTPELLAMLRDRTVVPRRELLRSVVERAIEGGGIPAGTDADVVVSALLGTYYADQLAGRDTGVGWAERTVAAVLPGVG